MFESAELGHARVDKSEIPDDVLALLEGFQEVPPNYEIEEDTIKVAGGEITHKELQSDNATLIKAILLWDTMDDKERHPEN